MDRATFHLIFTAFAAPVQQWNTLVWGYFCRWAAVVMSSIESPCVTDCGSAPITRGMGREQSMPRATPPTATHHDYTGQLKWVQACFPFPKANHVPLKGPSKQNTSGNSLGVCVVSFRAWDCRMVRSARGVLRMSFTSSYKKVFLGMVVVSC